MQDKEAEVERKLNTETRVLEARILEMSTTHSKLKREVRVAHQMKDMSGAKELFIQASSLQKQLLRFKRLHQICASMLDHVKEQNVMSTTSVVLQEFVSVHENLIKECNLEKLVAQYQELQGNVDDMRNDINFIGDAVSSGNAIEEYDWDKELNEFMEGGDNISIELSAPSAIEIEELPSAPVSDPMRQLFGKVAHVSAEEDNGTKVNPILVNV